MLFETNLPPVPPPPVELIVTCPVLPDRVMLVPATREVTIPERVAPSPTYEVALETPDIATPVLVVSNFLESS